MMNSCFQKMLFSEDQPQSVANNGHKKISEKGRWHKPTSEEIYMIRMFLPILERLLEKWGGPGLQEAFQAARDTNFAKRAGIDCEVNLEKHGYDLREINGKLHEVKHGKRGTFNDLTLAKIEEYRHADGNLYLVCGDTAWKLPLSNESFTDHMQYRVEKALASHSRRTPSVSVKQMKSWGAEKMELGEDA